MIIDNTNIDPWEFQAYLRIAFRYHFPTLLVEPKTAWRYNYRELARRNIHGVDAATIKAKVEKLQEKFVCPMYYGFTVSALESGQLRLWAAKLARVVLQMNELSEVVDRNEGLLAREFANRTDEELAEWKECEDLLHCTAFYTFFGKRPGVCIFCELIG